MTFEYIFIILHTWLMIFQGISILKFSVLIYNMVNTDRYKPHKEKLFGVFSNF